MKRILMLAVLSALSTGCVTYSELSGVKMDGQKTRFEDGRESLISAKVNTVSVSISEPRVASGERARFVVAVRNGTKEDLIFSTENISAKVEGDQAAKDSRLKVYSYRELVAEEKKRQNAAAFGAALSGISRSINASNAGYKNTYGSYSGNTGYGYGNRNSGTYSSTTYDYGAAQAAQDRAQSQTNAEFASIKAEGKQNLNALKNNILKKQTVSPKAWHGGVVSVYIPPVREYPSSILLKIGINNEEHLFRFNKVKVKN